MFWKDFLSEIAVAVAAYAIIVGVFGSMVPAYVVTSNSMYPAMQRGDIIVTNNRSEVTTGSVVVFYPAVDVTPVVHRVVKVTPDGYLTKGDNNAVNDVSMYRKAGMDGLLSRGQIAGVVVGHFSWLAYALSFEISMLTRGIVILCIVAVDHHYKDRLPVSLTTGVMLGSTVAGVFLGPLG